MTFLDLIITEKCNSKCRICSIWREGKKTKNELSIEDIARILDSKTAEEVGCVDLSGGEPFLREDLVEIVALIRKKLQDAKISISTNGLDTEKILSDLKRIRDIADIDLRISLDGLRESHNAQRGLPDAFERTMKTVSEIKNKFPNQHLTFIFVATPSNHKDMLKAYRLVKSLNPDFTFLATVAQDVSKYKTFQCNPEINYKEQFSFSPKEKKELKKEFELLSAEYNKEKDFANAIFANDIPSFLNTGKTKFCDVPENVTVVLPSKEVFSCIMMDSIGDLKKSELDDIVNSKQANEREVVCREGKCPGCMLFMGSHTSYHKKYSKPPSKDLTLKLEYACNQNCLFCIVGPEIRNLRPGNSTDISKIKDALRKYREKYGTLELSGEGEPTINREFFNIIDYAYSLGYQIELVSNGRMFAYDEFCKKLGKYNIRSVVVTLLSANPEVHDSLTKAKGSFKQTVQGIRNLTNLKIPVIGQILITKQNCKDMLATVKYLVGLGVSEIRISCLDFCGYAETNFDSVVPRYSEVVPFVDEALSWAEKKGSINVDVQAFPRCCVPPKMRSFSLERPDTDGITFRNGECQFYVPKQWRVNEAKTKLEFCSKCDYEKGCEGIWKVYVDKYGSGEFSPVIQK